MKNMHIGGFGTSSEIGQCMRNESLRIAESIPGKDREILLRKSKEWFASSYEWVMEDGWETGEYHPWNAEKRHGENQRL